MQEFKFSYDKENDDLLLYNPKSKSKGSVELGDIVLDFDSKKTLVGIQIMNASKMIKDITNDSGVKTLLQKLKKCQIEVKPKNNMLLIKLYLISGNKEISPVLNVPAITQSSPALAVA